MRVVLRASCAAALFACAALAAPAQAQSYPVKAIRWIVPFPPGGGADLTSRTLAQKLSERLDQQVIVDNRPGSGGMIGLAAAAKLPADGYNIALGQLANLAIAPALYPKLPYDPVKDFTPVTLILTAPFVLVAHPSFPANNMKELIALAKARPDEVNYGSSGNGSGSHLATEMIKSTAKIRMTHVPYKGATPAFAGLLSGEVAIYMTDILSALPQLNAGRVKAIAVTNARRMPTLPNVPTIAESALPGFEVTNWLGVMAPAGLPKDILAKLHSELVRILKQPDVQRRFQGEGGEVSPNTPEEFAKFIRTEITKWDKVVRESGVKVE